METNEDAPAVDSSSAGLEAASRAALDAEIAAIQAEQGKGDETKTAFSEALESEGIDVEVKPKEEAAETPDPEPDPQPEPEPEGDGLDALLDAAPTLRDEKLAKREALRARAAEMGLPEGIAKAISANVKPEEAESYLDSLAARVQSEPAGQTTGAAAPPAGIAAPLPVSSEVLAAVEAESGEATAKAVAEIARFAAAEAEQARALAMQGAQAVHLQAERTEWLGAAGELSERFQGLVRSNGSLDPVTGQLAAALHANGPFAGDKRGSLEAAAKLQLGQPVTDVRQSATATPQPKTPSPSSGLGLPKGQPIGGPQQAQLFSEIERKYANDPEKRTAAYARTTKLIREHNAQAKKK